MTEILAHSTFAHAGSQIAVPPSELSALEIALEFSRYGAEHIVFGYDHLGSAPMNDGRINRWPAPSRSA